MTRLKRFAACCLLGLVVLTPFVEPILRSPELAFAQDTATDTGNEVVTETGDVVTLHEEEEDFDSDSGVSADYAADFENKRLTTDLLQLQGLESVFGNLEISPQDEEHLRNYDVDVRVTDYLISLVTPEELGGYGFKHIKVGRLFKNYDTDGVGQYDRETNNPEEDDQTISSHHRGQAADVTEVGAIQCKLVEKRRIGGNTTHWQAPKPVKVAWQSVDGIARNPTPKSPSLVETAGVMSAESVLRMLNESGEFDQYADYVRGLDINSILAYVGVNILLKGVGVTKITGDPMADSFLRTLGADLLEQNLSDLPDGLIAQNGQEPASIAVARARIEEELNLPPGTLRGNGWKAALKNAGKRTLENALGLPTLFLEDHPLSEATALDTSRAALRYFAQGDEAFDVIDGAIDAIQKNDEQGLVLAGVNVLGTALNLSAQQRAELEAAARQDRTPEIRPEGIAVNKTIPLAALPLFFSDNPTEQDLARQALKSVGNGFLRDALQKNGLREYEGIGSELYSKIVSNQGVSLKEVLESVGNRKLQLAYGLELKDVKLLTQNGKIGKGEERIAEQLNKEYGLEKSEKITREEVDRILAGKDFTAAKKIGGFESDKVFGWNRGTGYALLTGKKKFDEAASEIFSNSFGQILGLREGTEISLKGDVQKDYGRALLEQNLGLKLDKEAADRFNNKELLEAFGLPSNRSLAQLRADEGFWTDPDTVDQLALMDARLGAPHGASERYLRGQVNTEQFSRQTATNSIGNVAFDQLWSFFDLDDRFHLSRDESTLLFDTLKDWENAPFEQKDQVFQLARKVAGRSLDSKTGFDIDTFANFFANPTTENGTNLLMYQGVRQLALSFGVNLKDFTDGDLKTMADRIVNVFNGKASSKERDTLIDQILTATKIPDQYRGDAAAFARGDFRTVLSSWSAVIWSDFANKYLPSDAQLSYTEMRQVFRYDNESAIQNRVTFILDQAGKTSWTEEEYLSARDQARRELAQETRDNAQYKISDALLEQALGQELPADFSRRMMTGSEQERGAMLLDFGFAQLDAIFAGIDPSYQAGTLKKIYDGKLSAKDGDQLVLALINRSGVSFGPFDATFMSQFYSFIRSQGKQDFFTNPQYDSMWSFFDGWIEDTLGIGELPGGLGRSIYFAAKNGWRLDAGITDAGGTVIVPSLQQLGENFLVGKLSQWGDKQFNLPAGSIYQMYKAGQAVASASRALSIAKAAGDATKATQAASTLGKAQAELTAVVISIAINSCKACQQFFASVDQAIAAPPGFTNMAVSGAIAMALGLGPAGLIAAAVVYFVGVYRVDYLCPIPPPDRFALSEFDNPYDKLDYTWGDYYQDETRTIKDVPAPGENPFDWDEGVPFVDGNNPNLWRAWARYNTGKLLDASMRYGESNVRPNQPKQIVTFRRANAEFFYPRINAAFGELARSFDSVGFGYTQTTTKTTDAVHVAFGGFF
jgi:hypothetical protein